AGRIPDPAGGDTANRGHAGSGVQVRRGGRRLANGVISGADAPARKAEIMDEHKIKFEDGAVYERMMGTWSRLAGIAFLDWVALGKGLRWIDVGCGNGAFTELIGERCVPAEVDGVDPSEGQLTFARTRPGSR